ncbi:radical SAM protein [Candidatus Margulisiibacteriota bacterium]
MPPKIYKAKTLSLYLTQYCPLKCKYCIFGSQEKKHMPTEHAIQRIEEAHNLGIPEVVFTGGEPTLHPDFLNIFRAARKEGMRIILVTNGIPIKDAILEEVTEYINSQFFFSLDCFDEKINDKYRDKNAYKYVTNTINKVRKYNAKKTIGVNSILVEETLDVLPQTTDFLLNKLKVNVQIIERVFRIGNGENTPEEYLIKDINKYFSIINSLKEKYGDKVKTYTCDLKKCILNNPHLFYLLIFPDKNLYLCCNIPDIRMKIGDETMSLQDIMQYENVAKVGNKINKYFFERSGQIRKEKGIFGCGECIEEYKRLRDSGELDKIFSTENTEIELKKLEEQSLESKPSPPPKSEIDEMMEHFEMEHDEMLDF